MSSVLLLVAQTTQACPADRPLRVLVPYAVGGSLDAATRVAADAASVHLRRQIAVVNVPGASGLIAVRRLLASAPDGCTYLSATVNTVVILPLRNPAAGFRREELEPIAGIGSTQMILVASPRSGLSDMNSLHAAISSHRRLSAAHPGVDSVQAILLAALAHDLAADIVHVPYEGSAAMVNDLVGGHVDLAILAKPAAAALGTRAVTLGKATGDGQAGLPTWSGWFVARRVQERETATVRAALTSALHEPQTVEALSRLGIDVEVTDRAAFAVEISASEAFIRRTAVLRPAQ